MKTHFVSYHPQKQWPKGRRVATSLHRAEAYDFVIHPMQAYGNPDIPIPKQVVLLRPDPADPSGDQLFLDHLPVPREAWRYDPLDHIISWKGAFGGGHLHFDRQGRSITGNIGAEHTSCSVQGGARAQFNCAVALDCGVSYDTSGGKVIGLLWNPSSAAWQNARWVQNRLLLTYTVTNGSPIEPPSFTFEFEDLETGAIPWDPGMGSFAASMQLGMNNGKMVWDLTFKSSIEPPDDDGTTKPTGPDSVYPYWLSAIEDAAAATINGAMEIDQTAPNGTLIGMQGVRSNGMIKGYYRTSADAAPFGIFNGRLVIGGQPVARSFVSGNELNWKGLSAAYQKKTGLPETGRLQFVKDGSVGNHPAGIKARRLSGDTALYAIDEHKELHPVVHPQVVAMKQSLADGSLSIYGLLAMNPFVQQNGQWGDAVQAAVTGNLSDIMNSCIPSDLWGLLFPGMTQPALTGELAVVANSPVPGVSDPKAWYSTLSTAVLSQGLANGSDQYCKNLNGPRAGEWLKQQVSTSKVYYAHGQLLFQYNWQQRFPTTAEYLTDQINNAGTYATTIDAQVQSSIQDIRANVVADPASEPDMIPKLIAEVQAVGQYAKTNKLYWAFAYYTYNTAPAILANIALQMGINTGSSDGTTLSRLFQQNVSVLTALDPSGYFAQQYTNTINIFLTTNILPSMFGFLQDASSFDLIKAYLQEFVNNNINSEDKQIAQAAAQVQQILSESDADEILHNSITALQSFSQAINDAMAFPLVANRFVKWFSDTYPKFSTAASVFGGLFMAGVGGLAIFNLFSQFKSWDKLNNKEKAQLITDTTQLGLQIISAIVKRGIRVYAIFNVDGMSRFQRVAAINRIIATGEAESLDTGLMRIGNTTARWLGGTEGSVARIAAANEGLETAALLNGASAGAEEAGWVAKVLGKNLDEFIATRIGPIFILAGIGFSLYSIITGDSGVALASDIVNIVGGALMLFATIGEWAIAGGLIAAEGLMASIIAVAGPLAILAALAGVGFILYQMFQKPPDPVEQFVNNYAKPAGFYVGSTASSIDYATNYQNKDANNLLMIGFSLSANSKALCCNNDGSIGLGQAKAMPEYIWQAVTDGLGMSRILTIRQPDASQPPITVLLSLMSDNTISFQPLMPPPAPPQKQARQAKQARSSANPVTVVTQTWLSTPKGDATVTSDGNNLVSIPLIFQPVYPDKDGNYSPSNASGYLLQTGSGVTYDKNNNTTFTLAMSGMAPNYMKMVDMDFILNSTPSTQQSFGPVFGVIASTPLQFSTTGTIPGFLNFDKNTGVFSPNGQQAAPASSNACRIAATNSLGSAQIDFNIKIAAPQQMPAALQPA